MSDSIFSDDEAYFSPDDIPTIESMYVKLAKTKFRNDENLIHLEFDSSSFDHGTENFANVIALASLQQDEAEDDLVYKIFNNRDEVLRFASLCVPNSVNPRNDTIDFDSIPQTLLSTVGFCGPKDGLLDFLSKNSPDFYRYVHSESPPCRCLSCFSSPTSHLHSLAWRSSLFSSNFSNDDILPSSFGVLQ
ncbi:hypothetical protein GEMRC1_009111 [Eukaryota sp. GEM-RC1]